MYIFNNMCLYPGGGGGGGGTHPKFWLGMCHGKVKNGLRNELPVEREMRGSGTSMKMWGSGMSLILFERENGSLQTPDCQDASG